ncbi:MAG: sodium:panthothenate symporter [Lentisphaeria bacterium]|nr:sodium:panthothenate symporter [Lentisphaeria bacterium]
MSWIDWLIVIVPMVSVLFLSCYSSRYIRGVADFLAAGRVCGRYVICVADVANALAVVTLVAQVEAYYKTGIGIGFWNHILGPFGMILSLTGYCMYRYRATRALSLGQFLEMRYSKSLRIFAAFLRTFAETLCNMIVPAISARFFIYLLDLPHKINIFGCPVSTFGLVIITVLFLALFIIWRGGTVALIITDALQSLFSYPIFAIFAVFILCNFSWFDQIAPVLSDRVAGESFLDPYDVAALRDFNLFALLVTLLSSILNRASWVGAGSTTAGRTPHEQKMAGVLGSFRNGFAFIFYFLISLIIIVILNHADFAGKAKTIRDNISAKVAEEIVPDNATKEKLIAETAKLPPQKHIIGKEKPLSHNNNLDMAYLNTAHDVLGHDSSGNAKFQEFRTLYHQLMLPVTMKYSLPVGLLGMFVLLMLMLMLSTDDSRIFSGAITTVQDIILPLYGKPVSPKTHILLLRFTAIGIGICFFFGSFFMAQLDYINLFCIITTSIWVGGAGPVMVGGLYTRFGTTAGAYASLWSGIIISGGGVLVQRNWPDTIYPWLDSLGWAAPLGTFLETVSSPFAPYIIWKMDPVKFPINSNELFFLSMVTGVLVYCGVSFLTLKKPFDLDKMLHRDEEKVPEKKPNLFIRILGIDENYTRGDKIIAWAVFLYAFVYSFGLAFIGIIIWNAISPWSIKYWSVYFLIVSLVIPSTVAVISTFWFTIGGVIDMKRMFRDLAARTIDETDDGRVEK